MNAMLVVWSVLVGGWVLPEADPGAAAQPDRLTLPNFGMPQPSGGNVVVPDSDPGAAGGQSREPYYRPRSMGGSPQRAQPRTLMMPSAPTDRTALNAGGIPLAPTASPLGDGGSAPAGTGGLATPRYGAGTTGRAPTDLHSAPTNWNPQPLRTPASMGGGFNVPSGFNAPSGFKKPHTGFQQSSPVSPYMEIYRRGNAGMVDNYTSLVRPMLDQQAQNRQFQSDIGNVQDALRQPARQVSPQGQDAGQGGYFIDYRGYYPGLNNNNRPAATMPSSPYGP